MMPTRTGIRTSTSSDCGAFAIVTMMPTANVSTQPVALMSRLRRHPASRVVSQCLIMPAWLIVKSMKTPMAYSGISRCVSPWKSATSDAATIPSTTMPHENASRSPRKANWRGMNPSCGQDRRQSRKRGEARVRGEEQEQRGEGLEQEIRDRAVAVDARRHL